jgi:hypothetical protein
MAIIPAGVDDALVLEGISARIPESSISLLSSEVQLDRASLSLCKSTFVA